MGEVTLKLFATLQKHLPAGSRGRQARLEIAEGGTVGDLLETLGVPRGAVHIIMVNGEHRGWGSPIRDGDTVTVFPPVAGG